MIDESELLELLDARPPAWIVTRTRRLARELRLAVARRRAEAGRTVADTPPIRCLDDWFLDLGDTALGREPDGPGGPRGRVLLSRAAEQLLWEQVISAAPGDLPGPLLDLPALATTATEAFRRVCHWGEPPWSGPLSEDAEAFRGWLGDFRVRLEEKALVTAAELPALVADAVDGGRLDDLRPDKVVVLGFERPEPGLERLLGALAARGTEVVRRDVAPDAPAVAPSVLRAASRSAEVRTVASRIRARLLDEPGLRVAVLAPDLASYASLVERIFEEELDPAGAASTDGAAARRFDFARAPALADYPLAATALDLLGLGDGAMAFEDVSRVLLSEYPRAGGDDEETSRVLRGALEARLRRGRSARLRLAHGRASVAAEAVRIGLPDYAQRLEALGRHLASGRDARRSPGAWRREWVERLNILGWPGKLRDDAEGLVFRRWRDALEEFAGLEVLEATMNEAQALAHLRAICSSMPVQPSSEGLAVKVLGLLDAAGLEFDLVYVLGMTATAFPASPRPNPLLPVAWQRAQAGMPRASVEGEKELADAVWARLLRSSRQVVVTWPLLGESEEENTASAVIADLDAQEGEDAGVEEGRPWWLAASDVSPPRLERPGDEPGAPLVRRGGTRVLEMQSSCAFRSFVATRLGAEMLSAVQPQPDRARRGTLVHAALRQAYERIPSSTDLAGLSADNIAEVARDAAREAISADADFFDDAADLEEAVTAWLTEMVASWMLHERDARDTEWTVESMEKTYDLAFPPGVADPLRIRFRPDRVDRVGDGVVVLDFKTSATPKTKSRWAGERPDDPQLPLYLALLEQEGLQVDGLAFANLSRRDRCGFDGLAGAKLADGLAPPTPRQRTFPPTFKEAAASMRSAVEGLALAYLAGSADVNARSADACGYCGSQALCRVLERGLLHEGDEDEGGGEP